MYRYSSVWGYMTLDSGMGMILNNTDKHNVSLICCELLIGIQELTELERTGQDPMEYFSLREPPSREDLQSHPGQPPNVKPSETTPAQPPRPQPVDSYQRYGPSQIENVPANQQTVPIQHYPPPIQRQPSPKHAVAPQQATEDSPKPLSMEIHTPPKIQDLPAPKLSGHTMPMTQTYQPTNIDQRQQHGSGYRQSPQNQGSGPIEPMPIVQTYPPTNIDQRQQQQQQHQQHGAGYRPSPQNQGSGPIEPMPTTQVYDPPNIDQRQQQQHGSGYRQSPQNQGSGPIEPMPTTQVYDPPNIDQRQQQQHASGYRPSPQNQGSGPIEPIPTTHTFSPTNIDQRQQHASGYRQSPQNQGSGPIEPIPTTHTFSPTNIDQRQQHASGYRQSPQNQGSGPIEPIPTTQTYQPTNIDQRQQQHGSGYRQPHSNQGSGPIEPMPTIQTFPPTNIEPKRSGSGSIQPFQTHGSSNMQQAFNPITTESTLQDQSNKQNISVQPRAQLRNYTPDPSHTVVPLQTHESKFYQSYQHSHQESSPSNTGYSQGPDPSIDPSHSYVQATNSPYKYGQIDISQPQQSTYAVVPPSSSRDPQLNRGQEISQLSDRNQQHGNPQRTQSGRIYAYEGQHPSYILIQEFENIHNICPNFTVHDQIPTCLVDLARNCLQLSAKDKFSNNLVGEIILTNLQKRKPIIEICKGIGWLAKYCMGIYLSGSQMEVSHLKVCIEYFITPPIVMVNFLFVFSRLEVVSREKLFLEYIYLLNYTPFLVTCLMNQITHITWKLTKLM